MAETLKMSQTALKSSRRMFIQSALALTAPVALGAGSSPDYLDELATKLCIPVSLLKQHRAFLVVWLLLTTNPLWINGNCSLPDVNQLSQDLGGAVTAKQIQMVYDAVQKYKPIRSALVAAGNVFNTSPDIEEASGYADSRYTGKQCPPGYEVILSLFQPSATFKTSNPKCKTPQLSPCSPVKAH